MILMDLATRNKSFLFLPSPPDTTRDMFAFLLCFLELRVEEKLANTAACFALQRCYQIISKLDSWSVHLRHLVISQCTMLLPMEIDISEVFKCKHSFHAHFK